MPPPHGVDYRRALSVPCCERGTGAQPNKREEGKMKTLLLVSVSVLALGLPTMEALAAHPDTGPGCGLGKVAWQDYKHPEMIGPQLLMSTTNNTILPWQAFG